MRTRAFPVVATVVTVMTAACGGSSTGQRVTGDTE